MKTDRAVTLKHIAHRTGYSLNTVSRALRNMPDISSQTKERIRLAASEMGYVPNALAASLSAGRTQIIALIMASITNPHYHVMIDEFERLFRLAGYMTIILCTHERDDLEASAVQRCFRSRWMALRWFRRNTATRMCDRC